MGRKVIEQLPRLVAAIAAVGLVLLAGSIVGVLRAYTDPADLFIALYVGGSAAALIGVWLWRTPATFRSMRLEVILCALLGLLLAARSLLNYLDPTRFFHIREWLGVSVTVLFPIVLTLAILHLVRCRKSTRTGASG